MTSSAIRAVLTDVLPLAVAIALSPLPVIAIVLMLLSEEGRVNAAALLAGWALTIFAIAGLVVVAGIDASAHAPRWVAAAEIAGGAALVGVAAVAWARRAHGGAEWGARWLGLVDRIRPPAAFGLAVALGAFSVKDAALALDAGSHIEHAALSASQQVVVLVVFALVASVAVALPLAVDLVAGERAAPLLRRWHRWLERHSRTAAGALLGVLGIVLIANGAAAL